MVIEGQVVDEQVEEKLETTSHGIPQGRAMVPRQDFVRPLFKTQIGMTVAEMQLFFEAQWQLLRDLMKPGIDFGPIPGTTTDRTLFKAGAEKLLLLVSYAHEMTKIEEVLDWEKPFFFYRYRCDIYDRRSGALVGQAYGSCNSRESKYAYRWVPKGKVPPELDVDSLPQKTRPKAWTLYRVPNAELCDLVNTIDKMAQKRAFVGAVRVCTGASGLFAEEGVPLSDERNGKKEAELAESEEVEEPEANSKPKGKPETKKAPDGLFDAKIKFLYNKANAALQEQGIVAHYTASEHVKNALREEGLTTVDQVLRTSDESLVNLLVSHAKQAKK